MLRQTTANCQKRRSRKQRRTLLYAQSFAQRAKTIFSRSVLWCADHVRRDARYCHSSVRTPQIDPSYRVDSRWPVYRHVRGSDSRRSLERSPQVAKTVLHPIEIARPAISRPRGRLPDMARVTRRHIHVWCLSRTQQIHSAWTRRLTDLAAVDS